MLSNSRIPNTVIYDVMLGQIYIPWLKILYASVLLLLWKENFQIISCIKSNPINLHRGKGWGGGSNDLYKISFWAKNKNQGYDFIIGSYMNPIYIWSNPIYHDYHE